MKITNLAIRYRPSIAILTVIIVLGGLGSYITIPKESFPSIEIPNIVVTTTYPGASPGDIESLLTEPIEREIQAINGIKEIRSTSVEGVSSVVIEFNPEISMDEAFQKVRDKVDIAKSELPGDVEEPLVSEIDLQEFPIMAINLSAPYSLARLKTVAENLAEELETIPNVLEVPVIGGLEREIQVSVDIHALQGYNLAFEDVVNTIQSENTNLPGGSLNVDRLDYLVRINGEFERPEEEISSLVIDSPGDRPVYVRDIATVNFGYMDRASYARLRVLQVEEGRTLLTLPEEDVTTNPVVTLNIRKRSGANILVTAEQVREVLDGFDVPIGTRTVITGDMSDQVLTFVKDLENNIISGLIFVVLVLLFFLGIRNATLVGIAIPLSMLVSFIVFQSIGQELNFVILFSLIIALGMLVDNAVVIVENIYRFREMGYDRWEAAKSGTAEVGGAVVASTATTVAAFIPMLFWPGLTGEFMSYLPLTLIVTLTCSLFIAIVINPVITGFFMKLDSEDIGQRPMVARRIAAVAVLAASILLGITNWKTLVVLSVTIPLLYLLNTRVFSPIAKQFVQSSLPQLLTRYKSFLQHMLTRDYTQSAPVTTHRMLVYVTMITGALTCIAGGIAIALLPQLTGVAVALLFAHLVSASVLIVRTPNSYLRNCYALGAFTIGVILLVGGAIVSNALSLPAGLTLLMPGALLFLVGLAGIFMHMAETLYLGGRTTVRAGLAICVVVVGILLIMAAVREVNPAMIATLIMLPAGIVIMGSLGAFLNGRVLQHRDTLLLTDNRARLLTLSLGGLFSILGVFAAAPTGVEFFPDTDPTLINISLEAPLGTNVDETDRVTMEAQSRVNELLEGNGNDRSNVKNILVNVGTGGDALFGGGARSSEKSVVTLNMVDYSDRPESSRNTMTRLRNRLQGLPGIAMEFQKDNPGPPVGAPVNIEVTGEDFGEIARITSEIKGRLQNAAATGTIPGLVDINDNLNTGRPELRVNIDRERAARLGLNTQRIASTVRSAINGIEASKYRTGQDEYDIIVRLSENHRQSLESVKQLTIVEEGEQIPITAVADFEIVGGLGSITRLDLDRVATVTGDVESGFNGAAVLSQVQQHLDDFEQNLPPGYALAYTGENEEQAEAFGFLFTALMIGVAGIFMIMIAQFNSISSPIIIIIAVGLSLIGVLLGLTITRTPFGLMTFIGVISLAGIVVNNNIVLIDYIKQLRERGNAKMAAIIEGGATRLRPVVLTVLTTVIGLVPLTFGINIDFVGLLTDFAPDFQFGSENTQFWGAMGTAIISGLLFATFLTLVIVPVMYSVFDSLAVHIGGALRRVPADDA